MYLVLAVYEIERLADAARKSRDANGSLNTHCIVLRDLETCGGEHTDQVCSGSWANAVLSLEHGTEALLETKRALPKDLAGRVAELESFVRDARDNYDCDSNGNCHGPDCRACKAEKLLPK